MSKLTNLDKFMILVAVLFFAHLAIEHFDLFSGSKKSENTESSESMLDSINGESVSPQYRSHVQLSKFSATLGEVSTIRMLMQEYYMNKGVYPTSLSDLRMDTNNLDTGKYIESIKMKGEGTLHVNLRSEHFGGGRFFIMEPVNYMGGNSTRWECKTNVVIKHFAFKDMCKSL